MTGVLAVVLLTSALLLAAPPRRAPGAGGRARPASARADPGGRRRVVWSVCAAVGGLVWVEPPTGWALGLAMGVGAWVLLGRVEPPQQRRSREQTERDLPHVVLLLGLALGSGTSLAAALDRVARALPGPATDPLDAARRQLAVGVTPAEVWAGLAEVPGLGPLGRTLARSESSGAPIAGQVRRLAGELAADRRSRDEDRARAVGVRAAVPLGVCLLPAFLVLGIVPVVVTTLGSLTW